MEDSAAARLLAAVTGPVESRTPANVVCHGKRQVLVDASPT